MTSERRSNFSTWGSNLPDEFLLCRDIGHTEREQTLSHFGAILSGHYNYAEGYLAPAGTDRITSGQRDSLRLESITRLLGHDSIDHGIDHRAGNSASNSAKGAN